MIPGLAHDPTRSDNAVLLVEAHTGLDHVLDIPGHLVVQGFDVKTAFSFQAFSQRCGNSGELVCMGIDGEEIQTHILWLGDDAGKVDAIHFLFPLHGRNGARKFHTPGSGLTKLQWWGMGLEYFLQCLLDPGNVVDHPVRFSP